VLYAPQFIGFQCRHKHQISAYIVPNFEPIDCFLETQTFAAAYADCFVKAAAMIAVIIGARPTLPCSASRCIRGDRTYCP
jgi:hypothetical protein